MNERLLASGVLVLLVFILLFRTGTTDISAQIGLSNYTIKGNSVFVNDSNIYLAQAPHTTSGKADIELMTKSFTGDIDVVFGFNTTNAKPKGISLYNPRNITVVTNNSYTCLDYFNYTLSPKHFWCFRNVTYVNCTQPGNTSCTNYTKLELTYDHDFDTGNLTAKTAYWTSSETHQEEYQDFSNTFQSIDYNYGGNNKWYYAKNLPVIAGKMYEAKLDLDIQVKLGENSGKYWICTKPSSETIAQAIANSHLYCLDPWWNSSYGFRSLQQNVTAGYSYIANSTGCLSGGASCIHYLANTNGSYLYYTTTGFLGTYAMANESTQLNWFNGTDCSGNNPSSVYDAMAVYTFDQNTGNQTTDCSGNGNTGTCYGVAGQVCNWTNGKIGKGISFDGSNDYIYVTTQEAAIWTIEAWINPKSHTSTYRRIIGGVSYNMDFSTDGTGILGAFDGTWRWSGITIPVNVWSYTALTYNGSTLIFYVNGSSNIYSVTGGIALTANKYIGTLYTYDTPNAIFSGIIDELKIYNRTLTPTEIQEHYQLGIGNRSQLGPEETDEAPITPSIIPFCMSNDVTPSTILFGMNASGNVKCANSTKTYFEVYNGSVIYLTGSASIVNETNTTMITWGNFTKGEVWNMSFACSNTTYNSTCSTKFTVGNTAPICSSAAQSLSLGQVKYYTPTCTDADLADTLALASNLTTNSPASTFFTTNGTSIFNPHSSLIGAFNTSLSCTDSTATAQCSYILTVSNCTGTATVTGICVKGDILRGGTIL